MGIVGLSNCIMRKIIILIVVVCSLIQSYAQTIPYGILSARAQGNGFQTETNTYLAAETTAGKTYTSQQQLDIDTVFRDLKGLTNPRYTTYNVLSKLTIIYPFFSGVSASDKVNMVNPGTYNYTETGSPTYSTSTYSVAFNGTSQYLNTTHTPNCSGTFGGSDLTMYAYHRIDNNTDANGTIGALGCGNTYMQILNTSGVKLLVICGKTANSSSNSQATARLWWTSFSNSSTVNAYYNGTLMTSTGTTYDNTPTRSILIGAFNNAAVGFGGACTVDFYCEGTGSWSDAEEAFMYNCFKQARADVLGITWN